MKSGLCAARAKSTSRVTDTSKLTLAGVAVASALLTSPACADATYTDLGAWEAAVGSWGETTTYGTLSNSISSFSLSGGLTISGSSVNVNAIGNGWGTWCCGYTGQVLSDTAFNEVVTYTGTLSRSVAGMGFFVEPNFRGSFDMTLTLSNGLTLTQSVPNVSGAKFFGWTGDDITSFSISSPAAAFGFAMGDFFVAAPVPGPIAGAGLPGLILAGGALIGWLRRKRNA